MLLTSDTGTTKMSRIHRHKTAYRYEYDRPSLSAGLRYRLQRAHFGKCAVRGARLSSIAARNLAVLEVVEERDDDHWRQDHVDDVADCCRDGVDAVLGGQGGKASSSAAHIFCAFCLALCFFSGLTLVCGGRFVVVVVVVAFVIGGSVEIRLGGDTRATFTGPAVTCRGARFVLVVFLGLGQGVAAEAKEQDENGGVTHGYCWVGGGSIEYSWGGWVVVYV